MAMKQQVKPAFVIAAILVAVIILAFIGWRSFGSHTTSADTTTVNARIAAKKARGAD
jgi:hypothetical protein